jgi:hypothetical protein
LALAMLSMISTWMLLSNIGGKPGWVTYWASNILSSIYINNYKQKLDKVLITLIQCLFTKGSLEVFVTLFVLNNLGFIWNERIQRSFFSQGSHFVQRIMPTFFEWLEVIVVRWDELW